MLTEKFKLIDFWVNVVLIVLSVTNALIVGFDDFLENGFLSGYFIVGGWQIISMIVHVITKSNFRKYNARFVYTCIAFFAVVTIPGSFWILFIIAPFMAIFYTVICYSEVYNKKINHHENG